MSSRARRLSTVSKWANRSPGVSNQNSSAEARILELEGAGACSHCDLRRLARRFRRWLASCTNSSWTRESGESMERATGDRGTHVPNIPNVIIQGGYPK
jgi:hypothetical protein